MKEPIYITTTLPYVNAEPHLGFAAELIRADISARYFRQQGKKVILNTGTDEHGPKIAQTAANLGQEPQQYVDSMADKYKNLAELLAIDSTDLRFVRTTDSHHIRAAQEFWRRVAQNGFIEKRQYQAKYCVGCELFKTDSELVDGKCPIHPTYEIELVAEKNYFFLFSKFQKQLQEFYHQNEDFVLTPWRFIEAKVFVDSGLEDFSISREKSKVSWGVPVPGDDSQVMYVWFDALVSYISTLGWPEDEKIFTEFWPGVQYCGKDNLRQQAVMWQAMLKAAGLPFSKHIIVNGFIVGADGQKMSKSIGNVITPQEVIDQVGVEGLRYYVFRHLNCFEDSRVSLEIIKDDYNAGLANGLGNLASRILKMVESYGVEVPSANPEFLPGKTEGFYASFEQNKAAEEIYTEISVLDKMIQTEEPFKLYKTDPEGAKQKVSYYLRKLNDIVYSLLPVLPLSAPVILNLIKEGKAPEAPLFPRL